MIENDVRINVYEVKHVHDQSYTEQQSVSTTGYRASIELTRSYG